MSKERRPHPDALLAEIKRAEAGQVRGRLKIFLGMCPGVGKTYAMLLAAQQRQEEGSAVAIGVVETHGRIETTALTAGLPRLPLAKSEHRGITLNELDLDAALTRRPALVLVDELAHTNAPGSRHPKRYQDVLEILEAGIDVYTTLNVQHIESYRDVVTQITGAPVQESVPDSLLDRADEVELVDISPDQLRKRLDEGKVYLGDRATAAADHFFREGNLKALREIALRLSAELADRAMRQFMQAKSISGPWKSRERLLVAVGPSPYSERLIRWTRRIANAIHSSWVAVHADTGRPLDAASKSRLEKNLSLARTLGAEVILTSGPDVVEALLRVAQEQNVSQIIAGKPLGHPVLDFLRGGSLVDKLIRRSGEIDIHVVRVDKTAPPWRPGFQELTAPQIVREYGLAMLIVLATTILGLLFRPAIGYMAVGLLYLLSLVLSSASLSRWPILLMATLTALAWNFLFIEPYYTFYIGSIHDVILFGMYFVVALVLGHLHTRLRQRESAERRKEEQMTALYRFTHDLTLSHGLDEALTIAVGHLNTLFEADCSVFLREGAELNFRPAAGTALDEREFSVSTWTLTNREAAGRFTDTLPQSQRLHLPLIASGEVAGVLAIAVPPSAPIGLAERQMIETLSSQIAQRIERQKLQAEAEQSKLEEKSRHLQKTLLDSISHEFKTPLAVISAALDGLRDRAPASDSFITEIRLAVERLTRVVGNLLDITRIETGAIRLRLEWCELREIFDSAIQRVKKDIGHREVVVEIADNAGAAEMDTGLTEELLANLLRNAAQYSPAHSPIRLSAEGGANGLQITVADEGPGVPPDEAARIFEKFQRGANARPGGLGMGLSIVKGFAEVQGGSVTVSPRRDEKSGAEFRVCLPVALRAVATLPVPS